MSNARDVALYFLNLGAACPPLSDVEAALQLLNGDAGAKPPPPPPQPEVIWSVVDTDNGLSEFVEFPGLRCSFEGAKSQFSPDSKAWNTININSGEAQFAADHPELNALHIAVVPCVQTIAPGSNSNYYWHEDKSATAFANSISIPSGMTDPYAARDWLRAHAKPGATGDGSGFYNG